MSFMMQGQGNENNFMYHQTPSIQKIGKAFSILCLSLAIIYAIFGLLIFFFKEIILEEMEIEDHFKYEGKELSATSVHSHVSRQKAYDMQRSLSQRSNHSQKSSHSQRFVVSDDQESDSEDKHMWDA
mmetsp:Transcript_26640/g.61302  ORF Transcript_26640/g.61302 Transcript_26640/m.61302 type:complete len:127 (+) Transcript_26640:419-799(+)